MCGITGFLNRDGKGAAPDEILKMGRSIRHRGPDDEGAVLFSLKKKRYKDVNDYSEKDNFEGAVAHTRLSILDLSSVGHQPMINTNQDIIISYNGEAYNAFEYKGILEKLGYSLKSRTDTEIILYLYEHFGLEGMLNRLNGMFAICIIDLKQQKMILVRDRLGIKPLYYYMDDNVVMFSSEIKAFLYNKRFVPELEISNLDEYTKFGYIYGKENLFKKVYDVEPGHYVEISCKNIKVRRYWEIPNHDYTEDITYKDAIDLLEEKIKKSVKLRLLSDVKIGCQLSGGIDSSLITLYASNLLKDYELHSFSTISDNQKISEEPYIDFVNKKLNTINHKIVFSDEFSRDDFLNSVWHFDFPSTHPSNMAIMKYSQKAKKYFSVFLSGEGADELFGGYERFYSGNILSRRINYHLINCNPFLRHHIHHRKISDSKEKFDLSNWFITTFQHGDLSDMKMVKKDFNAEKFMTKRRDLFNSGKGSFLRKAQRYELNTWLVCLLERQDKMTMSQSIENRVPIIDHDIIDFARKLPVEYLVRMIPPVNISTKRILKHIAAKHFGKKFAYRYKVGFALPVKAFFENKRCQDWLNDTIIPGIKSRGIFNHKLIRKYNSDVPNLNEMQIRTLWNMINFEVWAKMFLDKKDIPYD